MVTAYHGLAPDRTTARSELPRHLVVADGRIQGDVLHQWRTTVRPAVGSGAACSALHDRQELPNLGIGPSAGVRTEPVCRPVRGIDQITGHDDGVDGADRGRGQFHVRSGVGFGLVVAGDEQSHPRPLARGRTQGETR